MARPMWHHKDQNRLIDVSWKHSWLHREAEELSRYSGWLRAGWSRGRSSRPGLGQVFFTSSRPVLGSTQVPIWVVGLFTGHCHIKGHHDDPICERCLEEQELSTHTLCYREAIDYLRFRHLSQFFMEPNDYYGAPINTVLHFSPSVGLIKC
jgi:hypothetical protein